MQNLVVFMEPSENAYDNDISLNKGKKCYDISFNDGNKFLNLFCIDEDAAFELSGVRYLEESIQTTFANGMPWFPKGKGILTKNCIDVF